MVYLTFKLRAILATATVYSKVWWD